MKRVTISVNNKKLHLVLGGTEEEWSARYGGVICWDILFDELIDGTLEINEDIWYWYIDGRCYETDQRVNDMGRSLTDAVKSHLETAHRSLCAAYNRSKLDGCATDEVNNLSRLSDEISNLY